MNPLIEQHFDTLELRLLQSPAIRAYQIIRREISLTDGKLRLKAVLSNDDILELFEYVATNSGKATLEKYSFHWQDAQGKLVRRWDNAPHFPHLPYAPHHIHQADGTVEGVATVPSALAALAEIEETILT